MGAQASCSCDQKADGLVEVVEEESKTQPIAPLPFNTGREDEEGPEDLEAGPAETSDNPSVFSGPELPMLDVRSGLLELPASTLEKVTDSNTLEDLSDLPSATEKQSSMVSSFGRVGRTEAMSQLEVDAEIMRGIPLAATLLRCGKLWRQSPLHLKESEKERLWTLSQLVLHFDVFLSHTWTADARAKFLTLLFQLGWPVAAIAWASAMGLAWAAGTAGYLPMPLSYTKTVLSFKETCPLGPWSYIFGLLAMAVGFKSSPYLHTLFRKPVWCFLDVVSIHQKDVELQERGIYGLGGFLSSSREMWVLWSPQYLSRTWCIFELAAFRKANPSGKIRVKPIFIESQVFALMIGTNIAAIIFYILLSFKGARSEEVKSSRIILLIEFLVTVPLVFVAHANRRCMREKQQLISDLLNFTFGATQCHNEADREFVTKAIQVWYGSIKTFEEHVRGPLREELLSSCGRAMELPIQYGFMILAPPYSVGMDLKIALDLGGAPDDVVLSAWLGSDVSWIIFWGLVSLKLLWVLCDRFAASGSTTMRDCLISICIYLAFAVVFIGGAVVSDFTYMASLSGSVVLTILTFLVACLVYFRRFSDSSATTA